MRPISVPSGLTQGQSWPPPSDWFLTSSSPGLWATTPHNLLPRGLARSNPVVSTALRARTSVVTGSARGSRKRTMHDSGFHASVVGSTFGHCSIPLCLSQNSNGRGQASLPRGTPSRGGGAGQKVNLRCRLQGQGWEWWLGRILGTVKGDDPYTKGLCCPREWPEGWESSGADPCNPSDYSAMPSELQGGRSGKPKALSHWVLRRVISPTRL